jgi:SHS2 domain-containing protein
MAASFFREIEHTADLGIEVEADSPAELFSCAGRALFSLMVNTQNVQIREERRITIQADGWEDLFHDWLARLLREFLQDGFIAATVAVDEIDSTHLHACLAGEKLDYDRHEFEMEIKAVTYHQLAVVHDRDRWRVRVIFDV